MHYKFTKHGKGDVSKAISYLISDVDSNGAVRKEVKILRGDPDILREVSRSLTFTRTYTSGVIAWANTDNPTDAQVEKVLDDYEKMAFAGLSPQQYCWSAILHRDSQGTPHVHTIISRVELESGKSLNVAPPGHQRDFDSWRNYYNELYEWAKPDDPSRSRLIRREFNTRKLCCKNEIVDHLETKVKLGFVNSYKEVLEELRKIGEIKRIGKDYISIELEPNKKRIRLRGALFSEFWTLNANTEKEGKVNNRYSKKNYEEFNYRCSEYLKEFNFKLEKRAKYNSERYQKGKKILEMTIGDQDVGNTRKDNEGFSSERSSSEKRNIFIIKEIDELTRLLGVVSENIERLQRVAKEFIKESFCFRESCSRVAGKPLEHRHKLSIHRNHSR